MTQVEFVLCKSCNKDGDKIRALVLAFIRLSEAHKMLVGILRWRCERR
jgi:hypothetical protein